MSDYFSEDDKAALTFYLKARRLNGIRVPPVYVRHWLARQWRVTPQEIEGMPPEVIEAEMEMMKIEQDAERYHQRRRLA